MVFAWQLKNAVIPNKLAAVVAFLCLFGIIICLTLLSAAKEHEEKGEVIKEDLTPYKTACYVLGGIVILEILLKIFNVIGDQQQTYENTQDK